jgi:hypothetical protein
MGPVVRELADPLARVVAADLLEGLRYRLMSVRPSTGRKVVMECVTDQGVCERVSTCSACFSEQSGGYRLVTQLDQGALIGFSDPGENVGVEIAAYDRGQRQCRLCLGPQACDAPVDHFADAHRQSGYPQVRAGDPSGLPVLMNGPRFGEVPEQFTDEEGIAVCLGRERVAKSDAFFAGDEAVTRFEQSEELVVV